MKSYLTAGASITAITCLLAFASKNDRSIPDARQEQTEKEFAKFREIHARLLDGISRRLDRIDGQLAAEESTRTKDDQLLGTLVRRVDDVAAGFHETDGTLRGLRDAVARLRKGNERDLGLLGKQLLQPSVQVSARGGVGGGTVVRSEAEIAEDFGTYVLTAFHVVQKSIEKDEKGVEHRSPISVRMYREDGTLSETVESDLVLHDERHDMALLKLKSKRKFPCAARLASRERIRELSVFTPIYTVGCPLGHDPLPSSGEITTLHKEVNGERFWMMDAPTIFGNSGGGVFHRDTMEMIGVSAMICTFDNPVTTPVPHLGILVPLDSVFDWLRANHFEFIFDSSTSYDQCERDRAAANAPAPAIPATKTKADW